MQEFSLKGKEYIQLNQLLKICSLVGSGGEANLRIDDGEVIVDGKVERRRRNKLRLGAKISFAGQEIIIVK